jgi:hypothetical protein
MSTFVEFTKPTMMPAGGMAGSGENIGFDPVSGELHRKRRCRVGFRAGGAVTSGDAAGQVRRNYNGAEFAAAL